MYTIRNQAIRRSIYFLVPPAFLLLVAIIVYYPSLHYEFQFDDIANISKHFAIRNHRLTELIFSGTRWISYWINSLYYSIDKFNPFYYRVGNVIIHCINGLLVFFILLLGLSNLSQKNFFSKNAFKLALLTALLFLLHPVQTQTVSYVIQGQLEGMAVLSILSMSFCFLLATRTANCIGYYALVVLLLFFAALSCGTKEIAIVSPLLILLLDWFFVAQGDINALKRRWILHTAIFMTVGLGYLWLMRPTFFMEVFGLQKQARNNIGNIITTNPQEMITPGAFFISQFKVILHYLWIFIWPYGISVEYDWKLSSDFFAPDCIVPLLLLVGFGFIIAKLLRYNNHNLIAFCALWFLIAIFPRSSIIPSAELMFDYKTYGASFGVLLLLASALLWGYQWLSSYKKLHSRDNRNTCLVQGAVTLILAFILGVSSYQRNKVWSSGLLFWEDIVKKAPGKARAYNNYGVELSTKLGRYEESIPYFRRAIAMDSKYPDPCNNLAVACATLGRIDEAIDAVKRGLKINPYYPEGYNNLASFLITKKDYVQSERAADTALKLRPYYGKAWLNKGRGYIEQGREDEALECFRNACTIADLDNEFGFSCYAQLAMRTKHYDEAINAYQKLKEINPASAEIDFNLANTYFLADQSEKACTLYEQLVKRNPSDCRSVYNLGESYFRIGAIEKALECYLNARPFMHIFKHLGLRIAECYDGLGNKGKAKETLEQVINDNKLPDDIKKVAQESLEKLTQTKAA